MHQLYEITIPGFSVAHVLPRVRRHLLAVFPQMVEVLATLVPATIRRIHSADGL
jgi:hypothetical protein